ncbi:MAG: sigma-70 family RNA polymerase sigma factor [Planctomycetota bacterium]
MSEIENTTPDSGCPEDWVDRYGDALFAFAVARTDDPSLAEDLVQETFLAAIAAYEDFKGKSRVSTWLFAILKRKVIDHYRKQHRREKHDRVVGSAGMGPINDAESSEDPSLVFQNQEFWKTFDSCVEKLPDRLAEVFILREINQTPPKEIRELLGINATNLSMRLHRCRQALRECLDRNWFDRH